MGKGRLKGEREQHYVERMEKLFGLMKASGFTRDQIEDIVGYLRFKETNESIGLWVAAYERAGRGEGS